VYADRACFAGAIAAVFTLGAAAGVCSLAAGGITQLVARSGLARRTITRPTTVATATRSEPRS
jgi:stage V sporulation protein SpoVS